MTTVLNFSVPPVTPAMIQPPAVTPPALLVTVVDETSKGIKVAQSGSLLTITDSGVVPPPGYQFPVGSTVTTIGSAPVRNAANADGSAGTQIGSVAAGAVGIVKGTPVKSNNTFNWLQVAFAGITGYVGDDNLTVGGVNPQTPQS